jgi:hypothetical protein
VEILNVIVPVVVLGLCLWYLNPRLRTNIDGKRLPLEN